jgi:hypothetical protein
MIFAVSPTGLWARGYALVDDDANLTTHPPAHLDMFDEGMLNEVEV